MAEVAFAVPDDMHGRGIASLLLEHLVWQARQHGLRAFTAETLAENSAMLRVFADAGLPAKRRISHGVVELTFPLPSGEDAYRLGSYRLRRRRTGRGEAAQQRELGDREPVQAEPQQAVGLVGIAGQFLQLVQDLAMQEAEQGPVEMQGVGSAEAGPGEQREDVFERPQGVAGPEPERGGQRPGDPERHDVRVGEGEAALVAGDSAQLGGPVGAGGVDLELGQDGLGDTVEQGRLVRGVPVDDHRVPDLSGAKNWACPCDLGR